jgi:cytochrome c oxidase subunit III
MPRPGTIITEDVEIIESGGTGGGRGGRGPSGDGGGGDFHFGSPAVPQRAYVTGITVALAGILMFFMALTSAYIVRKGLSNDWRPLALPKILWLNTVILVASSGTIFQARRKLAGGDQNSFRYWWGVTTALGMLFLAGQLVAWRQLAAAGVYLASNPSSSFFYVLTAAHGLHLLGGVVALFFVALRSTTRLTRSTATEVVSIYWHFMDGLWVFLLLLLFLGR